MLPHIPRLNVIEHCANPECMKPLRYLREGTVYAFEQGDVTDRGNNIRRHGLGHYWLCGECCIDYFLEQTPERTICVAPRRPSRFIRRPPVYVEQTVHL